MGEEDRLAIAKEIINILQPADATNQGASSGDTNSVSTVQPSMSGTDIKNILIVGIPPVLVSYILASTLRDVTVNHQYKKYIYIYCDMTLSYLSVNLGTRWGGGGLPIFV